MENFINFGGSFPDTMGSIHKWDIYLHLGSTRYKHTEKVISHTLPLKQEVFKTKNNLALWNYYSREGVLTSSLYSTEGFSLKTKYCLFVVSYVTCSFPVSLALDNFKCSNINTFSFLRSYCSWCNFFPNITIANRIQSPVSVTVFLIATISHHKTTRR